LRENCKRDPKAFERECLAQFQDSISGFLPPQLVGEAVESGLQERPFSQGHYYIGALDPAFRRDAFAVTIMHNDQAWSCRMSPEGSWAPARRR